MSFDKDIQDKFSGYEPEVPEAQIDAGWEKIKYFLPAEEKKKRGFFFYKSAKGMGMAALLLLAPLIAFWLISIQGNTGTALARVHTTPASRVIAGNGANDKALRHSSEKSQGLETVSSVTMKHADNVPASVRPAASSTGVHAQLLSSSSIHHTKAGQEGETKPLANDNGDDSSLSSFHHSQTLREQNPIPAPNSTVTGNQWRDSANIAGWMVLLKESSFHQEEVLVPDPELVLLSANFIEQAPSNKTRPAIELFSGLSNRSALLQTTHSKNTVQAYGFSAGLAGIFPLRPKLYLSGQFVFGYNPVQYLEQTEAKEITKRVVVPSISSSLTNLKDTFVYYVPYQSSFELKSSTAWHLSGGVGYQLLNKGRVSLDGTLSVNLSSTRFSYRISRLNSDTGLFVNTIQTSHASSFYESVETSASPAPASEKKSVIALGLSPGLSLIYQLNKRTGLVFKPAYMMQISTNTLQTNGMAYRLRENNWFINLGLRYRL